MTAELWFLVAAAVGSVAVIVCSIHDDRLVDRERRRVHEEIERRTKGLNPFEKMLVLIRMIGEL